MDAGVQMFYKISRNPDLTRKFSAKRCGLVFIVTYLFQSKALEPFLIFFQMILRNQANRWYFEKRRSCRRSP